MKISNFDAFVLGFMIICGFVSWLHLVMPNYPMIAFAIGVASGIKLGYIQEKIKVNNLNKKES